MTTLQDYMIDMLLEYYKRTTPDKALTEEEQDTMEELVDEYTNYIVTRIIGKEL